MTEAIEPRDDTEPADQQGAPTARREPRYIVGIGASAGGLEALRALFAGFRSVRRLSFVVAQHLAPQHRSRLVELIAHETALRVREIEDGMRPEAGVVYVTPPNADLELQDGRLRLRQPRLKIGPKPSIDLFFTSLADALADRAVGVILSGTGSDGAHGIRAIKAADGLTLCQTPEDAKYDGMPRAAVQTGAVDRSLPVEQLASNLLKIDAEDGRRISDLRHDGSMTDEADPYARILSLLDERVGVDLSDYKQSTVRRRMERRVIANGFSSLADYADFFEHTQAEARLLFAEILISVTAFFRDPDAFAALASQIERRIAQARTGSQFRVWVAGCATGEEVYSIAILVQEAVEKAGKHLRVQIFATDLDDQALLIARKGTYTRGSLGQMSPQLVEKYFQQFEDRLQLGPQIRDSVVFARHDLVSDPPFLGLDLVACRNVLIYFNTRLQERVLRIFHYSLQPDGLLFLGRSETAHHPAGGFEQVDRQAKLFVRLREPGGLQAPQIRVRREAQREAELATRDRAESQSADSVFLAMVESVAPDSVLVTEDRLVRQVFGNASDFLRLPAGEPTTAVGRLVPAEVSMELSTLLHRASRSGRAVRGQRRDVTLPRRRRMQLQLQVIPIHIGQRREYLIGFERFSLPKRRLDTAPEAWSGAEAEPDERIALLESELKAVRESLQLTVEEHETANEELQALNEELQSTNEELQSSNEELETTNEELQSTNEELTTLNQEVNVKSAELSVVNQRLAAIQSAISYPLLIVDRELRLQSFNPAARQLFRVAEDDVNLSLRAIPAYLDLRTVAELLEECLIQERDRSLDYTGQGRQFDVRVQLFRDPKGAVAGAVISFVETTDLMAALNDARTKERQVAAITENTPALITMKDTQGVYTYANSRFRAVTGRSAAELLGRTDEELFGEQQGSAMREADFDVLKTRRASQSQEVLVLDGEPRWWLSARFPLLDGHNRAYSVCTVAQDVTERVRHERELTVFRRTLSDATDGIVIFEHGGEDYRAIYRSGRLLGDPPQSDLPRGDPLLLGDVLRQLLREADEVDAARVEHELRAGGVTAVTYRIGSDEPRWVELRGSELTLEEGGTRYLVLVLHDVTPQVRNEKALQDQKEALGRFSRLASLGEIAAGISHEINTPLNAITIKTELMRRMVDAGRAEPERLRRLTDDIDRMVANIDQVIAGLKSISRLAGRDQRELVPLRKLVEDTLRIVGFSTRRHGVDVQVDVGRDDVDVWCNPVQICQILVNLINNALDATHDRTDAWVRIVVSELEQAIVIEVRDNGSGVPAEIAEKIMTPFFTTKDADKGTGLGLSLSRTIARRHGGELEYLRDAEHTTFRLTLPRDPDAAALADERQS